MKKIIYSFIALITSICCLGSFTVSAADDIASDIYDNTIFNPDMRSGELGVSIISDFITEYFKDAFDELQRELDGDYSNNPFYTIPYTVVSNAYGEDILSDITVSDFQYLCGKTRIKYYRGLTESSAHYINVRIDICYCSAYKYDYTKWLRWDDGVSLPVNCLNYTITREDGTTSRYFLRLRSQLSAPWSLSFTQNDDNDYFSIPSNSYDTTIYAITGDRQYVASNLTYTPREKKVRYNTNNSVVFPFPRNDGNLPIVPTYPNLSYDFSDNEIINGYLNYHPANNTSYYQASDFDFYVSYFSSNRTTDMQWVDQYALTAPNQKNYYYQDVFKYGDVINNNNSDTIYSGSFDTIFNDVDLGDIDFDTIIPQITAGLQPTLQLGMDGLLDALMDFFGNMPDIGLTWNDDTDNNYYDIIPSEPDLPDNPDYTPWEPPEFDPLNTTPFIPATYPEFTVSTIPANIGETMSETLNTGWELADAMGLIAIAVPCALFVILWRITGK